MMLYLRLFIFTVTLLITNQFAQAHETRPTIVTLTFNQDRSYNLLVETNIEALIAQIGADHEDTDDAPNANMYKSLRDLSSEDLNKKFGVFSIEFIDQMGLTFAASPAELALTNTDIPETGDIDLARESKILLNGTIPTSGGTFRWAFPEKYGSSVLRVERPRQELEAQFFAAGAVSDALQVGVAVPRSSTQKFWDYMVVGFTHILPKGLDHILFVLGLFLLSTHWKPLLAQVTAFTLAHSVTLALGLYGAVNIAPTIVEPLIALSIVYVAVENLFTRNLQVWRPVIVFLFGLLHGLGFAGILTDIGLPKPDFLLGLISFNVGVEFGQLTVIALAFLAVGWFMKKEWYHSRVVVPASLAIAAMGAWWFVERTFL